MYVFFSCHSLCHIISQCLHNQTSVLFKLPDLLSILLHNIPHVLKWNNHLWNLKQKQCKHSHIYQDVIIILYFTAICYAWQDFFWNFKQKDQGTAATLCMIIATRMNIEKVLLIILQPKRKMHKGDTTRGTLHQTATTHCPNEQTE